MIVRALDENGDWTFGKGKNNYLKDREALKQSVKTRLYCFLGDCFFDISDGIDWFNRLGEKDQLALQLDVSARILNTEGVTGISLFQASFDPRTRGFFLNYGATTVYGPSFSTFEFSPAALL